MIPLTCAHRILRAELAARDRLDLRGCTKLSHAFWLKGCKSSGMGGVRCSAPWQQKTGFNLSAN